MKRAPLLTALGRGVLSPTHPAQLVLFVTDRCNCRCHMCYNAANVFSTRHAPDLDFGAIEKIAGSLDPLPQLLLSGGEPFVRRDIAEIVSSFYARAGTRQVSIPTNATFSDRIVSACARILTQCPDLLLNINLSLDNIGAAHDTFRGLQGCYDKFCRTYEQLCSLRGTHENLTVNIITVITERNLADAETLIQAIRGRFSPNYHAIALLRNNNEETETNQIMDTLETKLDLVTLEKQSFNKLPLFGRMAPAVAGLVKRLAIESRRERRRCFTCLAGHKLIVVTNTGDLMPCEPLWLEPGIRRHDDPKHYRMADLAAYDYDVRAAMKSDAAKQVQAYVQTKQCWCSYACAIQNGILYSPRMYLKLLREAVLSRNLSSVHRD